jgi:ribonuclease HII
VVEAVRTRPSLEREEAAWVGRRLLIGVDEVGRGPLAGPVVAAAAVFPAWAAPVVGVRDSKTLSEAQRAELLPQIQETAIIVTVAAASVREVDRYNIRVATALAMRRAVSRACAAPAFRSGARRCGATGYQVLLDGLPMRECGFVHEALVDGDALCYSVAAAGIVAKEVRDRLMRGLARRYPGYGWEHNAGYCTPEHCAAIAELGATRHHRLSFSPVAQTELF